MDSKDTGYINSIDYKQWELKIKNLTSVIDDLAQKLSAARKLRYAEVDVEVERSQGTFQPDELYTPVHLIDTNIRREQSAYVQYVTQSPRAVILEDTEDSSIDAALLEKDVTKKLRFPGWQLSMYANIDAFQSMGYGVMETVQDLSAPGEISREQVGYGDFGFLSDTRDLQASELLGRAYYFTKSKLIELCGDGTKADDFVRVQIDKIIAAEPNGDERMDNTDTKDRSLYRVYKYMFRVGGVVQVGWGCPDKCDDWIRKPRPLFLGRRKLIPPNMLQQMRQVVMPNSLPSSTEMYESSYPYFVYPYLISENDTISQLRGRVYLDQDYQEGASSLLSSTITKARRSAGLYGSMDGNDPNEDILMQKNITLKSGCIVNKKVSFTELSAPDPSMFGAINLLISSNQNETSQVNFAVNNRKDSRKTAKEIETATMQSQNLSTVQVVLFSIALQNQFTYEFEIIRSRVLAGLIKVNQQLMSLYQRTWIVKPSGDTDVIEKQNMIQLMRESWPMVAQTPMAMPFLIDLIELMFPLSAAKYIQALQQAQTQAQSQGAQMQQMFMQKVQEMASGLVDLSKHSEFFSDAGKVVALPQLQMVAKQVEEFQKIQEKQQMKQPTLIV